MDFLQDFIIGGISGAISSIDYNIGATMRPKFNNNEIVKWYVESLRKAIFKCQTFVKVFNLGNIPRYSLIQGLNFSLFEAYKQIFCPFGYLLLLTQDPQNEQFLLFLGNITSGSMAGATSALLIYPFDIARTYMIEDMYNTKREYNGMGDCIRKLYKKDGFKSLYRGFGLTVSSVALYRGVQFGTYNTGKETIFSRVKMENKYQGSLLLALIITELAGIIVTPLDIIRRELQMQQGRADIKYNDTIDCAMKIFKKEGINIIYRESSLNFIKRMSGAFALVVYDLIQNLIVDLSKNEEEQ